MRRLIPLLFLAGCFDFKPSHDEPVGSSGGGATAGSTSGGAVSCSDGVENQNESDTDCGGRCAPCADGRVCNQANDCASTVCTGNLCQPRPTCADGVKNQDESDIDCGGSCAPCGPGKTCGALTDCADGACLQNLCAAASCGDGSKNGDESDQDCGGSCPPCANAATCATSDDCQSFYCDSASHTCIDDPCIGHCGGACGLCAPGAACTTASDCWNGNCAAGFCQAVASNTCPGVGMSWVTTASADGKSTIAFCIDNLEVRADEYMAWAKGAGVAPPPRRGAQIPACRWNASYLPHTNGGFGGCTVDQGAVSAAANPVRCVDWCDAAAFCASRGRRLCGNAAGGSNAYSAPSSKQSEWYDACVSGNASGSVWSYPYGQTYAAGSCDDAQKHTPARIDNVTGTGADTACHGPGVYQNIFDLVGNVSEWEDACDSAGSDGSLNHCNARGGSYNDASAVTCASVFSAQQRSNWNEFTGFRCCE